MRANSNHPERVPFPVDPDLAPDDPGEPSPTHHPNRQVHRGRQLRSMAAIWVGGFLGTIARYGVERLWPTPDGGFPWATFTVNTSGAFLLGAILPLLLQRRGPHIRAFACVGMLGAWTTMSTFAVESDLLVKDGRAVVALLYAALTIAMGISCSFLGVASSRLLTGRREAECSTAS